jgi:hypothetical protein
LLLDLWLLLVGISSRHCGSRQLHWHACTSRRLSCLDRLKARYTCTLLLLLRLLLLEGTQLLRHLLQLPDLSTKLLGLLLLLPHQLRLQQLYRLSCYSLQLHCFLRSYGSRGGGFSLLLLLGLANGCQLLLQAR